MIVPDVPAPPSQSRHVEIVPAVGAEYPSWMYASATLESPGAKEERRQSPTVWTGLPHAAQGVAVGVHVFAEHTSALTARMLPGLPVPQPLTLAAHVCVEGNVYRVPPVCPVPAMRFAPDHWSAMRSPAATVMTEEGHNACGAPSVTVLVSDPMQENAPPPTLRQTINVTVAVPLPPNQTRHKVTFPEIGKACTVLK